MWFAGCNLRCPYCYNPDLVTGPGRLTEDEVLAFLATRRGKLDGVVMSGGECTTYRGLPDFCARVKSLGFEVKTDTNGTNPKMLARLLGEGLVDYVAIDVKAPASRWPAVTGADLHRHVHRSLELLLGQAEVRFEIRTTVHPDLLPTSALREIQADLDGLGFEGPWYLQPFREGEGTLGGLHAPEAKLTAAGLEHPRVRPVVRP